ncbi:hypothetical protein LTR99_011028 [Exophiala xenobiotica]|nr:hypothetical protein LTR99_011028 [Exophiala xenobiotica]
MKRSVNEAFDQILTTLGNLDNFGRSHSPSVFLVYAHDKPNAATKYDRCVHLLVKWLQRVGAQIISDRSLVPIVSTRHNEAEAVRDILSNQICLLPLVSGSTSNEDVISSVDKVLLCGSDTLQEYCESEIGTRYMNAIQQLCEEGYHQGIHPEQRQDDMRGLMKSFRQTGQVHHVHTELAFLQVRCQRTRAIGHGIIPVALDGELMRYVPCLEDTALILKLKSTTDLDLQKLFFKILRQLYVDHEYVTQAFQECHNEVSTSVEWSTGNEMDLADKTRIRINKAITTCNERGAIIYREQKRREEFRNRAFPITCQRQWLVPFGRNKDFVGRGEVMDRLLELIPPRAETDHRQHTAIEGLGGMGKTQMALEAAFRVRDRDPQCSVFWVPAVDVTSFENAYREIGQKLQVPGIKEDGADIKLLVKNARSQDSGGRWLLIVDNVDDAELFFGPAALCDYLPSSPLGSILFTTRNHQAVVKLDIRLQNIITAESMSVTEALEMLQTNLKDNQTRDRDNTTALLKLLAHLPLAIKQASAYMAKMGMSTTKYRQHCQASDQRLIELLSQENEYEGRYKGMSNAIATTWLVSFTHILRDQPLAADILRWSCFLVDKDIPVSLFSQGEDELAVDEAIGTLKAYAFITEREDQQSFDVHRLVQLAMRNWLQTQGQQEFWIEETMQRLADIFPFPEHENREVWRQYLPHVLSAVHFQEHDVREEADIRLLFNIAESYALLGRYREAEEMHRQALDLREKVLGEEHLDTLDSMNNLAIVLQQQGKYKEAEEIHRQALDLREKVLGEEHLDTLDSMNNLAIVLQEQGKYKEAEQMHRQTLYLMKKVLGEEHPSTLGSMNNLAIVLKQQGKYEEAEEMYRQALDLREKVLGEEHLDTLDSINNLTIVLQQQGKYKEAEEMHRQALDLREKVLGEEHPDTLASMNNLAEVLRQQGKYEEAEEMHRQTLGLRKKVLGEEHSSTLGSMNNLAIVLKQQGKYEEAEQMQRQALDLKKKVLGEEHPSTLGSMNNLAIVLKQQGKYEEAEQMHRQTLGLRKKVLGEEHPDTLASMNNLAIVLKQQGKYEEAEEMHRQTLGLRKKVLGEEYPDTLASINNLAEVLRQQGKYKEAEEMHRQALELREKVLGEEHLDTLDSMNNLAIVLQQQGKYKEAEEIHRQALDLREKVLGEEHPDTLGSMNNLAIVLKQQGKYEEAEQMQRQALDLKKKVLGEEHPSTQGSINNLALVLQEQGKHEEAEQIFE